MPDHQDQNAVILDQFGKQAAGYAALLARSKDSALPLLLETTRPTPDDRMLDVGCGAGHFAVAMAEVVGQVTGVDLTPAMLDQARLLQAKAGVANIEWRQADVTRLPFADASFDLVTSRTMMHHVLSPAAVLAEMRRVCAPGGRIAVADLTPQRDKAPAFDAIETVRDPSHVHAMFPEELRALGAELGLVEAAVRPHEGRLPLEVVLATSFPEAGVLDRVRAIYRADAVSGADALGFAARIEEGEVTVRYPMTLVVWTLP